MSQTTAAEQSVGTRFKNRLIRSLNALGLGIFEPVVRLVTNDEPQVQFRLVLRNFLVPAVSIALFFALWSMVAANVETSIGALPGPGKVWVEAKSMFAAHYEERAKEREFYSKAAERKATYEAQFPDKEYKMPSYPGKPTYPDQIRTSLVTVFAGFVLASLIAIPVGILCGLSKVFMAAVSPLIQVFKPVSPLAWLPIVMILVSALYKSENPMFQKSFISSAIVVSLCSLWPTLINTALGVASVDKDHMNVAKVLKLGWWTRVTKIVIPSSLPLIFTGLRLSLGVGWMVLIAAEMLAQNPGLGKFVWDMFQNGSSQTLAQIIVAVFTVGLIGFALDRVMFALQKLVSFDAEPNVG